MANFNDEYKLSGTQQEPVFRRRIDDSKEAYRMANKQYTASALNYPERSPASTKPSQHVQRHETMAHSDRKKESPLRWQQNYNTQDLYLGYVVGEGLIVDILMKNDSIRHGRIESYDNWSLLVCYEGKKSLLFKSGVMAITASDREDVRTKSYFDAEHLSDFSSEYTHNPA